MCSIAVVFQRLELCQLQTQTNVYYIYKSTIIILIATVLRVGPREGAKGRWGPQ